MKKSVLLFVVVSLVSFAAHADAANAPKPPVRPAKLTCVADGSKDLEGVDFQLAKLDTDAPESVNIDGTPEIVDSDAGVFKLDVNNGCDDDYYFIFFSQDLENLAKGEVKTVKGLLNYANPDSAGTVSVTCR